VWVDVNGDDHWDAVVPGDDGAHVFLWSGGGPMTDVQTLAPSDIDLTNLLAADLDNDGAVDLVVATQTATAVYHNDGAATFTEAYTGEGTKGGIAVLDLDQDGLLDLVIPRDGTSEVWINGSIGPGVIAFADAPFPTGPDQPLDHVTTTDRDLDGDPELFVRTTTGPNGWELTGPNTWTPLTPLPVGTKPGDGDQGVVLPCDVDGDGVHELLWTEGDQPSFFWTFDGADWATVGPSLARDDYLAVAACGDLDNDGAIDVYAGDEGRDRVFRQNGASWEVTDTPVNETDDPGGVTLVDYDDDGALDVLVVNKAAGNVLLHNDLPDAEADRHLQVRVVRSLGACPDRPVRDDLGASVLVTELDGSSLRIDVPGVHGHGNTGWPVLQFGVDPAAPVTVEVRFSDGTTGGATVLPSERGSPHRVVFASDDPDGDSVLDEATLSSDTDDDGYSDWFESGRAQGDDPCGPLLDTDQDTVPDLSDDDSDGDGVLDATEHLSGTDPRLQDTDGGGASDLDEFACGDPLDPADDALDADGDGALSRDDPFDCDQDTDDDGVIDGDELEFGTDPREPDTDDDALVDGVELGITEGVPDTALWFVGDADPATTTDPRGPDTDLDGLLDGVEDSNQDGAVDPGETDPGAPDTDLGGVPDGVEVAQGTDPLNASDDYPTGEERLAAPEDWPGEYGCGCGPR
ncbi:MAG: FG-GAP-like repeat-containing protein, partial [Myxococcota bacterium]